MGKIWVILISISIFLIITLIYWRVTRGYKKKYMVIIGKYGERELFIGKTQYLSVPELHF